MKFTVVTPSLNQGRYLPETLASVRVASGKAPTHEVEHVVADGGSSDGSLEILKAQSFATWWSEPDAGQADAVNRGWEKASGEILSFLCSDDLWEPETVKRVVEAFEQHRDVVLCGCDRDRMGIVNRPARLLQAAVSAALQLIQNPVP